MTKKNICRLLLAAGTVSAVFLLTACSERERSSGRNFEDQILDDFTAYTTSIMTTTPEGFYTVSGNFLYYISPDFQESTIVCSKPDCIHSDTNIENLYDYSSCDAFFFNSNCIDYYDGWLYISSWNGRNTDIYKVSLDGTERTLYYQGQVDCFFSIYNGYFCLGESSYTSDGKIHTFTIFPVDDPEQAEVVYETEDYPECTINRMRFYNGNCYLYLFDGAQTDKNGSNIYLRINLENGKTEEIYDQSDGHLEWNDYGIMAEVREYITFDPEEQWTSRYYHIDPDSGEEKELTEEDFSAIATNDMLSSMDDKYIYFETINSDGGELAPEEQKVKVYDYDGNLQAEIPTGRIGYMTRVLAGTEQYMFIQNTVQTGGDYELWYVDKSEFNGSTVEPQKIELAGRG